MRATASASSPRATASCSRRPSCTTSSTAPTTSKCSRSTRRPCTRPRWSGSCPRPLRRRPDLPKMWRVYSGADGKSHPAEVPLDMKPFSDVEGAPGEGTPAQTARSISFRVSPPGYELSWHCAPRRQYSISLSGQVEIEVGDGSKRRAGPGDIVLAEDLTGRGHIPRVVGDRPRYYALVPLAER